MAPIGDEGLRGAFKVVEEVLRGVAAGMYIDMELYASRALGRPLAEIIVCDPALAFSTLRSRYGDQVVRTLFKILLRKVAGVPLYEADRLVSLLAQGSPEGFRLALRRALGLKEAKVSSST